MAFKDFFILLLGVHLACSTLVSYLNNSNENNSSSGAADALSADEHVAAYWMRRTMTQPYRTWYLHDTESYTTPGSADVALRLPHTIVSEGRILFPLHVLYLYACGAWLQFAYPEDAVRLFNHASTQFLYSPEGVRLVRSAVSRVALISVVLVGAPAVYLLMTTLSSLLTSAAREREAVAHVLLPAAAAADDNTSSGKTGGTALPAEPAHGAAESPSAAATSGGGTGSGAAAATTPASQSEQVYAAVSFCAAATVILAGFVPLLVLEMATWQPWCLAGSLLVWAVYGVLQDELQLHRGASSAEDDDAAFDVATPIVEEGVVVCYARRKEPRVVALVGLSFAATALSLTLPAALYVTPLFFLWTLTSCWQHGYRRVLVKMKPSASSQDPSTFSRQGYSCYMDKLYMNSCFCYASMTSVATVLVVAAPWWWRQQPLLAFMDLFSSPPVPPAVSGNVSASSAIISASTPRSYTGAWEMQPHCLRGLTAFYSCALPAANAWRLSEWFGVPWTRAAKGLTSFFSEEAAFVDVESARWLDFTTVVLAVLANAASVVVFTFYRIRKPPLVFETPVRYAAERAAHQAEQQAYWEEKRRARRGGGTNNNNKKSKTSGAGPSLSSSSSAAAAEPRRTKVVTCLSREEYVVKQVVLLCWMLPLAAASGTVLFIHNGPTSGVLAVIAAALLAALYVLIALIRRLHPLAFAALPPSTSPAPPRPPQPASAKTTTVSSATTSLSSGAKSDGQSQPVTESTATKKEKDATSAAAMEGAAAEEEERVDPSALTQQDRDDPRPPAASRWSTSAVAPSLSHVADFACVLFLLLATVLSTGVLSRSIAPPVKRQYVVAALGVSVMHATSRLRGWSKEDMTSCVLFFLGGAVSMCFVVVLAAQSFPQAAPHSSGHTYLSFLTNKFGDMHTRSNETALLTYVYQCAVACVMYVCCIVFATLRIGRLVLEPEEVSLVPIESELSFFTKPSAQNKKQQ